MKGATVIFVMRGARTATEQLKNGAVFAVDRENRGPSLGRQPHHLRTGHHQGLFVGDCHGFSGVDRGPSPRQAGAADDGCHDHVDVRRADGPLDAFGAGQELGAGGKTRPVELPGGFNVGRDNVFRTQAASLLAELIQLAMGRKGDDFEFVGKGADDRNRRGSDAAGGAEEGDSALWLVHNASNRRPRGHLLAKFAIGVENDGRGLAALLLGAPPNGPTWANAQLRQARLLAVNAVAAKGCVHSSGPVSGRQRRSLFAPRRINHVQSYASAGVARPAGG